LVLFKNDGFRVPPNDLCLRMSAEPIFSSKPHLALSCGAAQVEHHFTTICLTALWQMSSPSLCIWTAENKMKSAASWWAFLSDSPTFTPSGIAQPTRKRRVNEASVCFLLFRIKSKIRECRRCLPHPSCRASPKRQCSREVEHL
jgi:hypothetical protein